MSGSLLQTTKVSLQGIEMPKALASIDIGSHTARLLISRNSGTSTLLCPLARKRAYIRLGEGLDLSGKKIIQPGAIGRTLNVLRDFLPYLKGSNAYLAGAVSTGVVREAANRDEFLSCIHKETGILVRSITGDEEALLTGKGVVHALDIRPGPFLVFDLGGGSTEFFFGGGSEPIVRSIAMGAAVLTQEFFNSDPPEQEEVDALSRYVEQRLKEELTGPMDGVGCGAVIGTGGTVAALAAMFYGISPDETLLESLNGLMLKRPQIEGLFGQMRNLDLEERSRLSGLDPGRAAVILAGCLVVIKILRFFKAQYMTVSLSDLLEGILIDHLQGEGYE